MKRTGRRLRKNKKKALKISEIYYLFTLECWSLACVALKGKSKIHGKLYPWLLYKGGDEGTVHSCTTVACLQLIDNPRLSGEPWCFQNIVYFQKQCFFPSAACETTIMSPIYKKWDRKPLVNYSPARLIGVAANIYV